MRLFNCALSSTGGYDSYTWQGPPGSGVSGSTLTTITSSVSGTYSLSALSGTTTYSQTVNVTFYARPSITVSASTSQVCAGTTVTLQALSGTQNTYTWNTGAVSESITVTPMNTYIYTAMGTNPFGCVYSVVKTITVVSLPNISIVPVSPVICPTQTINLAAISDYTPSAFLWNTAATQFSVSISPSATAVYSVSATNSFGCVNTQTVQISVAAIPLFQLSAPAPSICAGNAISISATGSNITFYQWPTTSSNAA